MPLLVYEAKSVAGVAALAPVTTANGMMLATPVGVAVPLLPLPEDWWPLGEKGPAVRLVAVKPLLTTSLFRTLLVVTPRGVALPVPPTKLTVAPRLRTSVPMVTLDPPAPVTGVAV